MSVCVWAAPFLWPPVWRCPGICFMFLVCVCVGWKTGRFCPVQTPPPDSIYIFDGDSALLSFILWLRCVFPAEMSEWSSEREGGTRGEEEEKFQAAEEKPDTQETRFPMKASLWPSNSLALPFSSAAADTRRAERETGREIWRRYVTCLNLNVACESVCVQDYWMRVWALFVWVSLKLLRVNLNMTTTTDRLPVQTDRQIKLFITHLLALVYMN